MTIIVSLILTYHDRDGSHYNSPFFSYSGLGTSSRNCSRLLPILFSTCWQLLSLQSVLYLSVYECPPEIQFFTDFYNQHILRNILMLLLLPSSEETKQEGNTALQMLFSLSQTVRERERAELRSVNFLPFLSSDACTWLGIARNMISTGPQAAAKFRSRG